MTQAERYAALIDAAADAQQITLCLDRDPHRPDAEELRTRLRALDAIVRHHAVRMGHA